MSFSNSINEHINVKGYQLIELIGGGSYAVVYRALDLETNNVVAIKCVERSRLTQNGQDNIISEIHLMKILKHDFIVEMKDFRWDDRYIYIILEFCDGGDLSRFIQKRQKLPEKICKRFMQQLAIGLQFLRSKNICHWDLKPQNLLLVTKPSLSLKIGDFGFAGFLTDDTIKQNLRGSPLYMAPEILFSQGFDARADLWSVGIIMYECLFGKAPLSNATCKQLLLEIKNRTPIEIPSSSISYNCIHLLKKLLVYDPNKRITYEEFYNHPFVDIEHFPGEKSYYKAVKIAREAVQLDYNKEYIQAFNMYCSALNYLIPFLSDDDIVKRERVRLKINEYTKRAEELKIILYKARDAFVTQPDYLVPTVERESTSSHSFDATASRIDIRQFKTLCSSTPKMLDAVDIGYAAQMYLYEGKYDVALDKFKGCFSMLLPLIADEQEGKRKKMLTVQVEEWMKQAESVNTLIQANERKDSFELPQDSCIIQ